MTLEECYKRLEGNYAEIKNRFQIEKLIDKFLLKFPADKTMSELKSSVESNDIETSFRAAHTLKGVSANLAFTALTQAADKLTEQLRPKKEFADKELLKIVEEKYNVVIEAIKQYESEK